MGHVLSCRMLITFVFLVCSGQGDKSDNVEPEAQVQVEQEIDIGGSLTDLDEKIDERVQGYYNI